MNVFFDFDGTLADAFPYFLACMNKLAREYGHETVEDNPELRGKGMTRILLEDIKLKEKMWLPYSDRMRDELMNTYQEIPLFPFIKPVLKKVLKHHTVGILSTNSKHLIRNSLEKEGFEINLLFTNISLGQKASVLRKILSEYNQDPSQFIYVGDECHDIKACREAGFPIIAVTWGFEPKATLMEYRPNYLIDEPSQLLELIF